MENQFSRTELIIGKEKVNILKESKVAVFGIGGVGSYVVEGLARSGIGKFILSASRNSLLLPIYRMFEGLWFWNHR